MESVKCPCPYLLKPVPPIKTIFPPCAMPFCGHSPIPWPKPSTEIMFKSQFMWNPYLGSFFKPNPMNSCVQTLQCTKNYPFVPLFTPKSTTVFKMSPQPVKLCLPPPMWIPTACKFSFYPQPVEQLLWSPMVKSKPPSEVVFTSQPATNCQCLNMLKSSFPTEVLLTAQRVKSCPCSPAFKAPLDTQVLFTSQPVKEGSCSSKLESEPASEVIFTSQSEKVCPNSGELKEESISEAVSEPSLSKESQHSTESEDLDEILAALLKLYFLFLKPK